MNKKTLIVAAALAAFPLIGCEEQNSTTTRPVAPDNTANNQNQNTTAGDQKNDKGSTETAANIRSAVVKEYGSMSRPAQVKVVVTGDGVIVLTGVVDTQAQKDRIGQIADQYRGSNTVTNNLEVKGASDLGATTRPSPSMTPGTGTDLTTPSTPNNPGLNTNDGTTGRATGTGTMTPGSTNTTPGATGSTPGASSGTTGGTPVTGTGAGPRPGEPSIKNTPAGQDESGTTRPGSSH